MCKNCIEHLSGLSPWIPVRVCIMCKSKNLEHEWNEAGDGGFVRCLDCGYGGGGANFWEIKDEEKYNVMVDDMGIDVVKYNDKL